MTPLQAFQDFLWSQEEKLVKALPIHLTAKRFISSACAYLEKAPKVLDCDRNSLVQSITKAAQMGLVIDGVESALVPRKAQCTLMIMFQGLLKLVRNSGELKDIQSAVVYEKDEFDYYTDENGEHLKHKRAWGDRGNRKLVYAIARTKDGGVYIEVMDVEQVMAVKKQGYNSGDSPWNGPFQDEMWRKSVIRRMAKRLPSSTDMESFAQDIDDEPEPSPTPTPEEKPAVNDKLSAAVAASPVPALTPEPEPPKPEPEAPESFTDIVTLTEFVERDYPTGKRWAGRCGTVSYGTSDEGLANVLRSAYEVKSEIQITFYHKPGANGKTINEIVSIVGNKVDDRPI